MGHSTPNKSAGRTRFQKLDFSKYENIQHDRIIIKKPGSTQSGSRQVNLHTQSHPGLHEIHDGEVLNANTTPYSNSTPMEPKEKESNSFETEARTDIRDHFSREVSSRKDQSNFAKVYGVTEVVSKVCKKKADQRVRHGSTRNLNLLSQSQISQSGG